MTGNDKLEELQQAVHKLAEELKASEAKLQHLSDRLLQLQHKNNDAVYPAPGPIKPSLAETFSLENFIGLRLIHLVGIVVLVIGLSIGVKYAIDKELISEMARVGLAYGAGGILYFLSLRLKKKYVGFSAILFSGAMASLYVTTYAAFIYYSLFPPAAAFLFMIGLTLFTTYNALRYNLQEIAVLGLVGAYAIPFLISRNSGRADLFFLYISILNTAVIFLSYKKGWKAVSYLAQIVTWILFLGWVMTRYNPAQQWIALLFGLVFFVLFLFSAVASRSLRARPLERGEIQRVLLNNGTAYVAGIIIFSPSFGSAEIGIVSVFFSLIAAIEATLFYFLFPAEAYTKKALGLLSLIQFLVFIANQWDGLTVTLLWLAASVFLFIWGVRSKAAWLRMAAIILMGGTLLKLITLDSLRFSTVQKIISYLTLGVLLLVVSFFYQKFRQKLFGTEDS